MIKLHRLYGYTLYVLDLNERLYSELFIFILFTEAPVITICLQKTATIYMRFLCITTVQNSMILTVVVKL